MNRVYNIDIIIIIIIIGVVVADDTLECRMIRIRWPDGCWC